MDFDHSEKARTYIESVDRFVRERVLPNEKAYYDGLTHSADFRQWRIPPIMEELKVEAKEAGLWNLFLPDSEHGAGLDNRDYAPLAEIMGRSFIAPEVFNCSAPDTGNAEVLVRYGSDEQKERWLLPLLRGEIRSGFAMTEPAVASSDATNMQATCAVRGDEVVINGQKWWTSGAGDPRCKFLIFMGVTDSAAERHNRHSMVIVPLDAPGVKIVRMVPVFGQLDEPHGHGDIVFCDVRVPKSNVIAGPGRGFEIAQGRLGPGRIHHCMRAIGAAERALERLCRRATSRVAFGKPLANLGGNRDVIANCRMAIEQARLLTLKAAWALDRQGILGAIVDVSAIKVIAPNVLQMVVDATIQIYGGEGVADQELGHLMAMARVLRLADGPDEVHRGLVARFELKKYV
jgi:acyl-CoA dehydrogenase